MEMLIAEIYVRKKIISVYLRIWLPIDVSIK